MLYLVLLCVNKNTYMQVSKNHIAISSDHKKAVNDMAEKERRSLKETLQMAIENHYEKVMGKTFAETLVIKMHKK